MHQLYVPTVCSRLLCNTKRASAFRLQYQQDAIAHYFATTNNFLPYFFNGSYNHTDGVYNRNGRGVPDVSASQSHLPLIRALH